MGKTFRRGGNERGYYSPGKSIRDKRQKGGTNRSNWADDTTMTTSNPKATKKDESLMQSMMMEVGTEIEKESEVLEFDDLSDVDYDLDYTVQY